MQLLEVAISLPILLMLFAATAEMGRLFFNYTVLAKGTRLAARYLTTVPLNNATNRATHYANARNLVVYGTLNPGSNPTPVLPGLTTNHVVITESGGVAGTIPQFVSVQINGLNFQPLLDLGRITGVQSLSLNVAMRPSTTMRYLITQPMV